MLHWARAESKVTGSWIVSSGSFAEGLIEDNGKDPLSQLVGNCDYGWRSNL